MLVTVVLAVTYLALLYIPGLALARAMGVPGWLAGATAPALTYGVIGIATPALGNAGIPWNLASAGAVFVVALVAAYLFNRFVLARWTAERRDSPGAANAAIDVPVTGDVNAFGESDRARRIAIPLVLGLTAGIAVGAVIIVRAMGTVDAVHQGWDMAWHANYTHWITDTGLASPLQAGTFQNWDSEAPAYYPSALHALGSLVETITGQNAVRVVNVGMLLMAAVLVPIGLAVLAWLAAGRRTTAAAVAAAIAPWFSIFPTDQIWRPAVPFSVGLALVGPVVVLLIVAVTRRPALLVPAALALTGVGSVHTSVAFVVAYFLAVWFVFHLLRGWRRTGRGLAVLAGAGVLTAIALAPQLKGILAQADRVATFDWSLDVSPTTAIQQVFTFGFGEDSFIDVPFADTRGNQLLLAIVAVIAGLVALRRARSGWLVATAVLFALLTVHATVPQWKIIGALTAVWYNDPWRIAAISCLAVVPVIGVAVDDLSRFIPRAEPIRAAAAGLVVCVLFVATGFGYIDRNTHRAEIGYKAGVLDANEIEAMRRIREITGGHGRVLNDPWDGSVWMYALGGQLPVFTHYDVGVLSDDEWVMVNLLNTWNEDPQVPAAAERLGVKYLFLNTGEIYHNLVRAPGYSGIDRVAGVRAVLDTGTAKLYALPNA